MKKLTKLIFAGLLALAIAPAAVLSLTSMKEPVQVKADSSNEIKNYANLVSALRTGGSYKLTNNISINVGEGQHNDLIHLGANTTLDLNGYQITRGNVTSVVYTDWCKLTITSSQQGKGSIKSGLDLYSNFGDGQEVGTIEITGGVYVNQVSLQNLGSFGKLNLKDGTIESFGSYTTGGHDGSFNQDAFLSAITIDNSNERPLYINGIKADSKDDLFNPSINKNNHWTISCVKAPGAINEVLNLEYNGERLIVTNAYDDENTYKSYYGKIKTTWYRSITAYSQTGYQEFTNIGKHYVSDTKIEDGDIEMGAKKYSYYAVIKGSNSAGRTISVTTNKYDYISKPYEPESSSIIGQNNVVTGQDITLTGHYSANQNNVDGNIIKYEYKWQKYNDSAWQDISGATKLTYKPSTSSASSSQFRFLVRAVAKQEQYSDWKESEPLTFVVGNYDSPSVSLETSTSIKEVIGYDVNVSASVTNANYFDSIDYQWYYLNTQGLYLRVKDGEHTSWGYTFSGATTSTLTIHRSTVSAEPLVVRLQATGTKNGYRRIENSVDSSIEFVNLPLPEITTQPQGANLPMSGASHAISVTAKTLRGTLSYQWQKSEDDTNWENINGATQWNYQVSQSMATEGTYYRCKVSNSAGDTYSSSALIKIKDGTVLTASLNSGLAAQFVDGDATGCEIDNENRTLTCHLGDTILIGFEASEGNATTSEKSIGTDWRNETGLSTNGMGKYFIDTSMIGTFEYYGRFYAEYDNVGNFQSVCYDRTNTDSLRYMVTVLGREDETEIEPVSVDLGDNVTIYPADYAPLFNNGVSTSSHAYMYGNNWASSVYDFAKGYRLFLGVPNEQEEIEYICVAKAGFYGQADPVSYHYNGEPLEFSTSEAALLELGITAQLSGAYDAYIVLDYLTIVNENDGGYFMTKVNSYEGHHFSITFNAPCTHEHTTTTYTFDYSNPAEPEIYWNETCDECGEVVDTGFIRVYEEGASGLPIIQQAATCNEDGMKPHKHFTEGGYDIYYVQDGSGNWVVCDDPATLIIKAKHTYTFVAEVPATKTTDGCRAHYICNECGGLFVLEDDVYYEVTEEQLIIKAEGYTVTFDANGGSGVMIPKTGVHGDYVLPACEYIAPEGKMFDAWEVNGQRKLPNETITVDADLSIKALWKDIPAETFTVSFNANGGSGTMNPVDNIAGEYALPQCTFTAPEGKEFAGWKVNGQGDLLQAGDKINVTANVELVAQWKDAQGGGDTPVTPDTPNKGGLPASAIVGIVIGSVVVVGLGGFALVWFVIKKKTWADFLALFKKK